MPEYKSIPHFTKAIDDRTVDGIFAVHGNVDSGGDRSFPGVFGDYKANGRMRVVYLWQHDYTQPPIAKIDDIYEIGRADLPAEVLSYAPEATGGTAVKRTYLQTPRADEVLGAIRHNALREMSYAYELTDWKYSKADDRPVRDIFRSDLLDVSDVNWGMNPATLGSKSLPLETHHQTVLAAVDDYIQRYKQLSELRAKEGRVLSGENRKRIESALDALDGAKAALVDLLAMSEKPKGKHAHQLRAESLRLRARIQELGL